MDTDLFVLHSEGSDICCQQRKGNIVKYNSKKKKQGLFEMKNDLSIFIFCIKKGDLKFYIKWSREQF